MSAQGTRAPVIVAGAGPTGLTLATELRRGGIDVLLLEQRAHRAQNGSRAAGMQPRTIEMLDQRGVVDRFLAAGPPARPGQLRRDRARLLNAAHADSPTRSTSCRPRPNRSSRTSPPSWASPVQWSTTVTGFRQDATGVDVIVDTPDGPATLRGSYLVACDGGRSTIRKLAGVGFPGTDATMACLTGEVELDDPPERPLFLQRRERGSDHRDPVPARLAPGRHLRTTARRRTPMIQSLSRRCGHRYCALPERISVCTARGGCRISTTPLDRPSAIGSGGCYWPAMPHTSTFRPAGRA